MAVGRELEPGGLGALSLLSSRAPHRELVPSVLQEALPGRLPAVDVRVRHGPPRLDVGERVLEAPALDEGEVPSVRGEAGRGVRWPAQRAAGRGGGGGGRGGDGGRRTRRQ